MATNAKKAAKAAPPVVEEDEGGTLEVGTTVRFLGYGPDTPAEEQVLTVGADYPIVGFTEANGEDPGGNPILQIENPDFNPKKKEHPENNPRMMDVEAFADELEIVGEEEAGEDETAEAEAAPPVAKTVAKKAAAAPVKAAAKTAAKTPAAKAGKKAAAAPVAAKKGKKAAAVEEEPEEEANATPDLETEDADVLALIEGSDDLIKLAQEVESQMSQSEYQFGGILYHIHKDKTYEEISEEYKEAGGFEKFLQEHFNTNYRTAMYLKDVYYYFNLAGIENAAETVAQMGWTKASKIAKHLVAEDANTDELIELANTKTVAELSEAIKDTVTVGGTKGEVKKRITLRFRYLEEEAAGINAILEEVRDQQGFKELAEANAFIIHEWAAANGGGTATKAAAPAQRTAKVAAKTVAPAAKTTSRRAAAAVA